MEETSQFASISDLLNKPTSALVCYQWPDRNNVIHSLVCPSDGGSPKLVTATAWPNQGFHGNYIVNAGDDVFGVTGEGEKLNGVFYSKSKTEMKDITDGTSKTLLASETALVPDTDLEDLRGRYWNAWEGGTWFSTLEPPNTTVGDRIINPGGGCVDAIHRPCASSGRYAVNYARSWHNGGVNTCMVDGSVHFYNDDIDVIVWRTLGGRNDGGTLLPPRL
jgi:prepilin-type processing-associated H-X9-DG protein